MSSSSLVTSWIPPNTIIMPLYRQAECPLLANGMNPPSSLILIYSHFIDIIFNSQISFNLLFSSSLPPNTIIESPFIIDEWPDQGNGYCLDIGISLSHLFS